MSKGKKTAGRRRAQLYVDGLSIQARVELTNALQTRRKHRGEEPTRVIERAIDEAFPGGPTEAELTAYAADEPWDTRAENLLRAALSSQAAKVNKTIRLTGATPAERLQYQAQLERGWSAGDRVSRHL